MLMRTGPFLPMADRFGDVYRGLQLLGTAAANVTIVLAIALLAVAATQLMGGRGRMQRVAGALVIASASLEIWLTFVPNSDPRTTIGAALMTVLALSGILAAGHQSGTRGIPLLALLTSYLAVGYYLLAQTARALELSLPGPLTAYLMAEAAAVAAAATALLLVRPSLRRAPLIFGTVCGAIVLIAGTLNSWVFGIAMMWNFSFTTSFPVPVYAASAAILSYTLACLWIERGASRYLACGLVLIAVGGLKLDSGYTALLALAGCTLVSTQIAFLPQRASTNLGAHFVTNVTSDGCTRAYTGSGPWSLRPLLVFFARIAPDHGHRTVR
jgi:hypothetical protein